MSILQEMKDALSSDAAAYMEFLYRYDPKKKQAFAFYEGDEDSSYYHRFLEESLGKEYELEEIVAGCRNNVLKIHREFDWKKYNDKQIIFFIDRDLSYWLGESPNSSSNIYVTDGYSVENFVVSPRIFGIWLKNFEGFARASKSEIDNMVNEYTEVERVFIDRMLPVMAHAIVAKRHNRDVHLREYKMKQGLKLSIENSHISFAFTEDLSCYEKWGLRSQDSEEITVQIETIKNEREHFSVRGKWLLYFMAEVGEIMRSHAEVFAPSLNREGKIPPTCTVPSSKCLPALAPYCNAIPKSLQCFMNETYGALKRVSAV